MRNLILWISLTFSSVWVFAQKPEIGIAEHLKNDSIITAAGFCCNTESIGRWVSPIAVSDEQFEKNIQIFKTLKTPIFAFNIFIPAELKVVGPDVNEEAVLAYVEKVMFRLSQTDTRVIIWGSGGSRRLPDGWDKKKAFKQIIKIGEKLQLLRKNMRLQSPSKI